MSFFVFANSAVKTSHLLGTNDCDVSRLLSLLSKSRILVSSRSVPTLSVCRFHLLIVRLMNPF